MRAEVRALPGVVSPFTASVLDSTAPLLRELASAFGGPLHYLDPHAMHRAIDAYFATARAHEVKLDLAFAKKANKASVFVDVAVDKSIGVDVASLPELEHALGRGVPGRSISVSGGAKPYALLERAVIVSATVVCDTDEELDAVAALAKGRNTRARVLLRFRPDSQRDSRFGFAENNLNAIADIIDRDHVDCLGVAFHCSGYDVAERAAVAKRAVVHLALLKAKGSSSARVVDVGGGFTVPYRDGGSESEARAAFHAGQVRKPAYPYATAVSGAKMLEQMLTRSDGGHSLAEALRLADATLMIEPGRSLLDQAGFTVTKVLGVRERTGYGIVTVDMTSFSLSESWFGSEYFVDPILLRETIQSAAGEPWLGCIAGVSCLESDMLAWRKIPFAAPPRPGDLLCFVNTAGYQMDSNESEFHGLPLPRKIVLSPKVDGGVRWHLDGVRSGDAS